MFLLPAATARLGATALAPLLCAALAALAALVFSDLPFRWHAAVAIAFFAAEGMLGATLQSVGSLLVAPSAQGRAFAALSMLVSLGDVGGNGISTRVYDGSWRPLGLTGRALPLVAVAALQAGLAVALGCARPALRRLTSADAAAAAAADRSSPPPSPRAEGLAGPRHLHEDLEAEERIGLLQRSRRLASD